LVKYLTAAFLDQGIDDRNPWINTLLQHPSTKEIMKETLGTKGFFHDFLDQGMLQ
jgi:hypothetical protein